MLKRILRRLTYSKILFRAASALNLNLVVQGLVFSGLKNLQRRRFYNALDTLFQCLTILKRMIFFSSYKALPFQLMTIAFHSPTMDLCKEPGFILLVTSLQVSEDFY